MNEPRTITFYKITHIASGRAYIGMTTRSISARWKQHKYAAPKDRHALHRAIAKYGWRAFAFAQLSREIISIEMAATKERELIVTHGTRSPRGFNLTSGGEMIVGFTVADETKAAIRAKLRGRKFSAETRQKMSDSAKARGPHPVSDATKEKHRLQNLGRKHTAETKAKISAKAKLRPNTWGHKVSAALAGRPHSKEHTAAAAAANRGNKYSDEARRSMSAGQKRRRLREASQTHIVWN